jgi:exosortase N
MSISLTTFKNVLTVKNALLSIALLLHLSVATAFLPHYFIVDANVYMGLCLAPYILIVKKGDFSFRYFIPFMIVVILLLFIPIKTLLFLSLLLALLLLIESTFGKINSVFILYVLILSPIYKYINNFIGFPIRLWLSQIAGEALNYLGKKTEVLGNIIVINNTEFSVDAACAGLNMMTTSFIIAIMIIAYYHKKNNIYISFFKTLLFLVFAFVLNMISNLFRILFLVLFEIMPDKIFHEIIGVLCLSIYVIIPLIYFSKYFFKKESGIKNKVEEFTETSPTSTYIINVFLAITLCFVGNDVRTLSTILSTENYSLKGFEKEVLKSGVTKLENATALVYIKPLQFYSAEHNPIICWKGSGYEFKKIDKTFVGNTEVYKGVIEKGNEKIYTAWWFDNGKNKTINQFNWRWDAFSSNTEYFLVNVNTSDVNKLNDEIIKLLNTTNYNQNI